MEPVEGITLVPVLHGRAAFAQHVRTLCTATLYDCIAVDVPECFEQDLVSAIDQLPYVSAVVADNMADPVYYVPTDPCDPMIEGIRQAQQNHCACTLVGHPSLRKPQSLPPLPDEYAVQKLGFEAYTAMCLHAIGNPVSGSHEDIEAQFIAHQLLQLRSNHDSVLALIHMRHFVRLTHHLGREKTHNLSFDKASSYDVKSYFVNPDHLYFVLGELPFVTGKFEQERYDLFGEPVDIVDTIKDLFRETRDNYFDDKEDIIHLSPARIQAALVFLRNLTVMESRFIPDLFDIVASAKGVGGNTFALRILKSAKYYPFLPFENGADVIGAGVDKVTLPNGPNPRSAVNLFRDRALVWRPLKIKPDPSELKKKKYRFTWDPFGMCSHIPEDNHIESFNAHVRKKAQKTLAEDFTRSEKFITSVKDGIDIRETLRNWYTGDIYVKELPPSRGPIDTVVIIFDDDHDERYVQHAAWYAEHNQESTLTFYATDPFGDMIGPGIARCHYGGLSLLFPPRPIPNAFELTEDLRLKKLSQRLLYGGLMHSRERSVAYVAARKPGVVLKQMAAKFKKNLVWIPLSHFSQETMRRLRRFHVLNGKEVRTWAGRFIGDE